MRKKILVIAAFVLVSLGAKSQIEGLKIQGYLQTQAEMAGKDGSTRTGDAWSAAKDGDGDNYWRYGVRRWRFRTIYTKGIAKGVFELNITESGVSPMLAYMQLDPLSWLSIQAGVINDYYGDELMYPSNAIEALERTNLTLNMFPVEHDLGMKVTLKAPKESNFAGLKLDLGLLGGNAISKTPDGRINFLGHLKYDHTTADNLTYGLGFSYYRGTVNNTSDVFYSVSDEVNQATGYKYWEAESVKANEKNKREYFGVDAQFKFFTSWGKSNFRGEFQWGTQPSTLASMNAPQKGNAYSGDSFAYNRKFMGWHLYYIQDIYHTPLSLVLKYAHADNNTEMDVDDIANAGSQYPRADLAYDNFGFGLLWNITDYLRATAFYDIYSNETNDVIDDYKDNRLTIRLQYKF